VAALKAGDRTRARDLLTEATRLSPGDERAWLWLSGAVSSDAERRACLERVLALNPQHPAALRGLRQLPPPQPAPASIAAPPVVPAAAPVAAPAPPAWTMTPAEQVESRPQAEAQPAVAALAPPVAPIPASASPRPPWLLPVIAGATLLALLCAIGFAALFLLRGEQPAAPAPVAATSPAVAADEVTPTAAARQPLRVSGSAAAVEFPDRIAFSVQATSKAGIERIELEYGVDKLTCGTVVARVFPEFKPGTRADVRWTWEMRQSGSEPPGASIWYRWRVTAKDGAEQVSRDQRVTWLDGSHRWEQVSSGNVTLHWYSSPPAFADDLLDTAVSSLANLSKTTGVEPRNPIHLYIYASTEDMRDAVLYEPGWTGGQAFAANSIVIIGIGQDQLDWGRRTVAHELTHVLVGHRTFSCTTDMPTWLSEGIAVYGEGGLEPDEAAQLDEAIADNSLFSVRALGGNFSEHPSKADLSYSQSWSLVNFLVERYGRDKLLALFDALKQGTPIDQALNAAYGFGEDGLEDLWRAELGAKPRQQGATPTATPPPTPVPTYAPFDGSLSE
jgi:hypothetical protein